MALKVKQIASMVGALVVVGLIAVYKDSLRALFVEKPKDKKKN